MKIQFSIILLLILSLSAFGQKNKMTAEEVVTKHLASIGTSEALSSTKSIIMVGNAKTTARIRNSTQAQGVAQFASDSGKVLLAMIFNETTPNYPYEKAGYDGENFSVSLLPEGRRSILGNFLKSNESIFKEGLIGGTLSSAWSLLNLSAKNPRLNYSGTEKVYNRPAHKLKYVPRKGGSGLEINLFFDAEDFRHVRSEYQIVIPARMGARPELSVSQKDSRYKMVEEFSDFKPEGKLTLPHSYTISYTLEETNNTLWYEWKLNFSQFVFNQQLDAKAFNVLAQN